MVPHVDFILGDDWLTNRSAVLNYSTKSLIVRKGASKIIVPAWTGPPPGEAPVEGVPLLSALQLKRALKKPGAKERAFLVLVKAIDAQATEAASPDVEVTENSSDVDSPADILKSTPLEGPCNKTKLKELLLKYSHVWPTALPGGLPPERDITVQHSIPLVPGAVPPAPRMYRLSPLEKAEVEKQVQSLLAKRFIQPSSSPYGAPLLFVPKPDGSLECIPIGGHLISRR
jgi:hypothetical protein